MQLQQQQIANKNTNYQRQKNYNQTNNSRYNNNNQQSLNNNWNQNNTNQNFNINQNSNYNVNQNNNYSRQNYQQFNNSNYSQNQNYPSRNTSNFRQYNNNQDSYQRYSRISNNNFSNNDQNINYNSYQNNYNANDENNQNNPFKNERQYRSRNAQQNSLQLNKKYNINLFEMQQNQSSRQKPYPKTIYNNSKLFDKQPKYNNYKDNRISNTNRNQNQQNTILNKKTQPSIRTINQINIPQSHRFPLSNKLIPKLYPNPNYNTSFTLYQTINNLIGKQIPQGSHQSNAQNNTIFHFPQFKQINTHKQKLQGWITINNIDYIKFQQDGDNLVKSIIRGFQVQMQ